MNFIYNVFKKVQEEINKFNTDFKQTKHYNISINTAQLKLKKYFKLIDFLPLYIAVIVLYFVQQFEYFKDK